MFKNNKIYENVKIIIFCSRNHNPQLLYQNGKSTLIKIKITK